jgi:hypothetical protein
MGSDERMLALSGTELRRSGNVCAEANRGRDSRGTAGRKPALLCGVRGAAKTLKFYRYGAKAMNTIKFEED